MLSYFAGRKKTFVAVTRLSDPFLAIEFSCGVVDLKRHE
jgi:hypothetical protein